MILLIVYIFVMAAAIGFGLMAAWSDFKGMKIPNYTAIAVTLAFFIAFFAVHFAPSAIFSALGAHLVAGIIVLGVSYLLFHFKVMGGGDSKLLTAFAFWVGLVHLSVFLFYVTVLGAGLGVVALIIKKRKPFKAPPSGSWIARLQAGESAVPYGVPIVAGAFITFWMAGYLHPDALSAFLVHSP